MRTQQHPRSRHLSNFQKGGGKGDLTGSQFIEGWVAGKERGGCFCGGGGCSLSKKIN